MEYQFGVIHRPSRAEIRRRREIAALHGVHHRYTRDPHGELERAWFYVEVPSAEPFGRDAARPVLEDLQRRDERRKRLAEQRACRHTVVDELEPECFVGPVSRLDPNEAAHGNITITQICHCGAERRVNVNQRHRETGPWVPTGEARQ